jgi:uncharacterized integral membrane protein
VKLLTILALLIAIIAVLFATQNAAPVAIRFLGWNYEASMALVALFIFSLGVLMGFIVSIPTAVRRMRKIANLKRIVDERNVEIQELEQQLKVNQAPRLIEVLPPEALSPNPPPTSFPDYPL